LCTDEPILIHDKSWSAVMDFSFERAPSASMAARNALVARMSAASSPGSPTDPGLRFPAERDGYMQLFWAGQRLRGIDRWLKGTQKLIGSLLSDLEINNVRTY
jgi:hypothetical protein